MRELVLQVIGVGHFAHGAVEEYRGSEQRTLVPRLHTVRLSYRAHQRVQAHEMPLLSRILLHLP